MKLAGEFCQFSGPTNSWMYTCLVTEASIKEPKTVIDEVKGKHEERNANTDVKSMHLMGVVAYIPRGLNAVFENLAFLTFYRCGLKSICHDDLSGYENLVGLSCDSNCLKSLPDDLFEGMTKLQIITFHDNDLEQMSVKLFDPIIKNGLKRVDFRNNKKIDAAFGYCDGVTMDQLMMIIMNQCNEPIKREPDEEPEVNSEQFSDGIAQGFEQLHQFGRLTDLTIIAGTKQFRVHKNILAQQSPVMEANFEQNLGQATMKIDDCSEDAVEQFIDYIYTGNIKDEPCEMELYAIAAEYKIAKLKEKSEKLLLKKLEKSNAFEIFKLAHRFESQVLKQNAFKELKKIFADKVLHSDLMDDPERVGELVEAAVARKQKIQEVEDEFEMVWNNSVKTE